MNPVLYPGLGRGRLAITGATSIDASHVGLVIDATSGSFTVSAAAAATLGAHFQFALYNSGSGSVVFDPASTETVRLPTGTATTVTLTQGQGLYLVCDGTGWDAVFTAGFPAAASTALTVNDDVFTIQDNADTTKKAQFQCSGITAGQTRAYALPDATTTLAGLAVAQTFTANQTIASGSTLTVASDTDATTTLGRVRLGSPAADTAFVAHFDHLSGTNYALAQDNAGATSINAASGQAITFRVANVTGMTFAVTGATIVVPLSVTSSTASTSTTTGALVVTGGAGIGGRLNVGSRVIINGATDDGVTELQVNGGLSLIRSTTGNIGIGIGDDTAAARWSLYFNDSDGSFRLYSAASGADRITLSSSALTLSSGVAMILPTTTPASASATGVAGTITWDASYLYVCTATNTWKRVAIATW